jgi:hypothetical protein
LIDTGATLAEALVQPQPLTLMGAMIPVAALILLVGLSYFLFGDGGAVEPNQVALGIATMVAVSVGWRRGHSLPALCKASVESVSTGISAIFILFAVGVLIGTWTPDGTDPVSRWSRFHRCTVASPTWNNSATSSSVLSPALNAPTTRSRRSNEYDHPIAAARWFINGRIRSNSQDHGTWGAL